MFYEFKPKFTSSFFHQMCSLEETFQRDIQISKATSTARIKKLQQQLEESENQWDEVQIARMLEIKTIPEIDEW